MADATPTPSKGILKSKTFWVQILTLLCALVPAVQGWIAANPVEFLAALAAVNVLVRFATAGKVTLFSDDESGNGSSLDAGAFGGKAGGTGRDTGADWKLPQRAGAFPWLVAPWCVVALVLSSCTPAQVEAFRALPITIGIEGQHGSYGYSSKDGLSVSVKVPPNDGGK